MHRRNRRRQLAWITVFSLVGAACAPTSSSQPSSLQTAAQSPAAAQSPTAGSTAPAASPTSEPSASAAYDVAGVGWESEFVFMEPHGFGKIKGLVGGQLGFVMWSDEAAGRPGFLVSKDGLDWRQVDLDVTGRTMLAVVPDRSAMLGLAIDARGRSEAWRSSDGSSWAAKPTTGIDGTPISLVVTPNGFAAAGRDRSGCGLTSWTSPDGLTWTPSGALPGGTDVCEVGGTVPGIDQLLAGDRGLLALGHLADAEPVVWTSPDARTWTRQPGPPAGRLARVAQGTFGYVAVGDDGRTPAGAAVWTSLDGATWTAAPAQPSLDGATMSNVVVLTDGSVVGVGSAARPTGGAQFAAWTSPDGRTWERSPAPLCQDIGVCDDASTQPPLLATDGRRLVAWDGSVSILTSPRVTTGLQPATLTLGFDGPLSGTWAAGAAAGFCVPADDPPATVRFGAGYPRLVDVGPASGTSTYVPSLQLEVAQDGSVQLLIYDRGDDAGFIGRASDAEPGAFLIDPSHVSVDAGSTPSHGRLAFRDVPVSRSDPGLPSVPPVSGSLSWSCG